MRNEANSSIQSHTCNICFEANSHDWKLAMQHSDRRDFEPLPQRLLPDFSKVGA